MSEYLSCDYCGLQDDTVEECIDPYSNEINGEEVVMILCPDCYQDRVDDI